MKKDRNDQILIGLYFSILIFFLLAISAVPLLIRKGIALSPQIIIEEEFLESGLILVLLAVSFLIWKRFNRRLKAYAQAMRWSGLERSKLTSRLIDAFQYIGAVNVELNGTMTAMCGQSNYPLTKKELKGQFHCMALHIMTMVDAPWVIIRMIQRSSGRTIKEYGFERATGVLPPAVIGNRAILKGSGHEGFKIVCSCQKNLDLHTAVILPTGRLHEEEQLLITAMANRIEMLFLLFQNSCLQYYRAKDIIDVE